MRSLFDLHLTLAVCLPDADAWHRLADFATNELGLFSSLEQREWTVATLYLLEERPDGRFRIRCSFALTGP